MSYKQNTVTVELENDAIIKTETVLVESEPETRVITIEAEKVDNKGVIIVGVALGLIGIVLLFLCYRQLVLKPKQQIIELEEKIKRSKNNEVQPTEDSPVKKGLNKYDGVCRDSIAPEDHVAYAP